MLPLAQTLQRPGSQLKTIHEKIDGALDLISIQLAVAIPVAEVVAATTEKVFSTELG